MTRTPVQSSNVRSVGYDPATKTMEVEFHSGGVYTHRDVTPESHTVFMHAPSKGKHYRQMFAGRHEPKA